jgi:hypothetical protein
MTTDAGGGERAVRTPFATATCVKRTCRGQLRRALHLQVAIEANTRLVVATGDPQPGNRNDCTAYRESGITDTFAGRPLMADGGYRATRGDRALPQASRRHGAVRLAGTPQCHPPQGPCPRRTRSRTHKTKDLEAVSPSATTPLRMHTQLLGHPGHSATIGTRLRAHLQDHPGPALHQLQRALPRCWHGSDPFSRFRASTGPGAVHRQH